MPEELPIFAIHGWALNAEVFACQREAFGRRRLIATELPGHGARRERRLGCDADLVACDLLALAPSRAIWLGWSLGGLLALAAALISPERIAALILVATSPRFLCAPDWPYGIASEELERMEQTLVHEPSEALDEFLALIAFAGEHRGQTHWALRRALDRGGQAESKALADGLALLRTIDHRGSLERIAMPALVIAGECDRLVRLPAAKALAAALAQGRLSIITGAGHAPFLSHPRAFAESIDTFLVEAMHDGR